MSTLEAMSARNAAALQASDRQVGGEHYKEKEIQLWDFLHRNHVGWLAGNVIKYVFRHKEKGGIEDLQKARHYIDKLIEEWNGDGRQD